MRLRYGIAVLVGSFGAAHSVMPANAECPTLRIDDEFKRSTAVFMGRAIAQSIATTPTLNWRRATETAFTVESAWKGEPDATIRVRVCGGTVGDQDMSCAEDFRLVVGSRYVVFADGQPLTTNVCHHTALLDRAAETLEGLSHKPQKSPPNKGAEVQTPESVSVNDPRPLNAAVMAIEQRCHCAITYEDLQWGADHVVDISGRPRIPKGGPFTFDAPPGLSPTTPAQTRAAMAQVLRAFEQSGIGRGTFRVTHDGTTTHVFPRGGSVLDTPVTISDSTRPLGDVVIGVIGQVGKLLSRKLNWADFRSISSSSGRSKLERARSQPETFLFAPWVRVDGHCLGGCFTT